MATISLMSVVGARPQFVKLAPIVRALADGPVRWNHRIVHTGQHYDYAMSASFFHELGMPCPDVNLNVGSGKHGLQTAAMISALEEYLEAERPDGVLVYGDTNSTLAATLAASKLAIPLFHVEAGLRSFDRYMPEEINRVIADHCAELLFAPTAESMRNLKREGLSERAFLVGDVMYDAFVQFSDIVASTTSPVANLPIANSDYAVASIHRVSNTSPSVLGSLVDVLDRISDELIPIVFPIHPRARSILSSVGANPRKLHILDPQPYASMLSLVRNARFVMTDSGGLQKEAAFLGTPCLTLRNSTEWTETIEIGANTLVGAEESGIRAGIDRVLTGKCQLWLSELETLYGDGHAAGRILSKVAEWIDDMNRNNQSV